VTLDAAAWEATAAQTLMPLSGQPAALTRATRVRALFDRDNLYVRVESELPGTQLEFAPAVRDGQPAEAESVEVLEASECGARQAFRIIVCPELLDLDFHGPDRYFEKPAGWPQSSEDPQLVAGVFRHSVGSPWRVHDQFDLDRVDLGQL